MAKYKRYRNYNRRRKTKWSANIKDWNVQGFQVAGSSEFFGTQTIITNPVYADTQVSQKYTIKNVEITFTSEALSGSQHSGFEGVGIFIMFVPQGMNITADYFRQHPEYIMAYKWIGSPSQLTGFQTYQPIRIKSRLSRTLDTGDSIVVFFHGYNTLALPAGETSNVVFNGLARWWTKAN